MSYNLIGQRFGRLRVAGLAPRGEKYPKQQWWHCVCDCGRTIDLPTGHLTDGKWKSCGCLQSDSRKVDITGERRGSLTAVRPTDKIKHKSHGGSVIWVWRCDCGKEIEAPASSVGPNGRTSCGCMRKPLNEAQAAEMRNLYLSRERIWRGLQSGLLKTTPQGLKEFAGINAWANGMRQSDLRECGIASDIMIASKTLQLLEKQQKIKCLNLCLRIISRRMTYRL